MLQRDGCSLPSFVPRVCERSEDCEPDKITNEGAANDGLDEQERGVGECDDDAREKDCGA